MKIALCMSGHARTYDQTFKFWKKNLLDSHDVDVFMHLWDTIGPRWFGEGRVESSNPAPREDFHSGIIDSPVIDVNDIIKLWNPLSIVVENYEKFHETFKRDALPTIEERNKRGIPAGFEHHHPLSVRSMLYKRAECNLLKAKEESRMKQSYDVVIQCRPDVALTQPIADDVLNNVKTVYFHNSRSVTKDPEICDFGSIGPSAFINFYCDLYDDLDDQMDTVGENFFQFLNPHKMYARYFLENHVPYEERDLGLCILRDNGIILGWPHATQIVRSYGT